MILLKIDMHTLLHCQRVNTFWQSSVKLSRSLQQKLWFLPDNYGPEEDYDHAQINPLIWKYYTRLRIESIGAAYAENGNRYAFRVPYKLNTGYWGFGDFISLQWNGNCPPSPGSWQRMVIVRAHTDVAPSNSFYAIGQTNAMRVNPGIFVRTVFYDRVIRSGLLLGGDKVITMGEVAKRIFPDFPLRCSECRRHRPCRGPP